MASTSTADGIQDTANERRPSASRPGGWLGRLDVFLSEPLRRAAPEELARCRVLVCIALWVMAVDVLTLLMLPLSPKPLVYLAIASTSLAMNGLVLARLRRRGEFRSSALLVCWTLVVLLVFACLTTSSPYTASHAAVMLVPALSVYLVGARHGLVFSGLMSGVVGVLHPVLFAHVALPPGFTSLDRKSTRLNSSHSGESRMPSSA